MMMDILNFMVNPGNSPRILEVRHLNGRTEILHQSMGGVAPFLIREGQSVEIVVAAQVYTPLNIHVRNFPENRRVVENQRLMNLMLICRDEQKRAASFITGLEAKWLPLELKDVEAAKTFRPVVLERMILQDRLDLSLLRATHWIGPIAGALQNP